MIKIFARKGTDQKALVVCSREQVGLIMDLLNQRYGKDWVWVDSIKPGEVLLFKDLLKYEGFHGREERYCNTIEKLSP